MVATLPGTFPLNDQPGFTSPDFIVQERLREQFRFLRANPQHVATPLASYGEALTAQIAAIIARRDMAVYEGWPVQAEQVPGIGVTLQPAAEEILTIGMQLAESLDGTVLSGTSMQASVICTCYGSNQREANALGQIVLWLLTAVLRIPLEMDDGLYNQSTALQDIRPETEAPFRAQMLFIRAVVLNCAFINTWGATYPTMTESIGGATDDPAH